MLFLLGLLAVALAGVGGLTFFTGRRIGPGAPEPVADTGDTGDTGGNTSDSPGDRVAAWMDDGLRRTGRAVDVLVDSRTDQEVLRLRGDEPERRRVEYVVVGAALIGLAVVQVVGLLLFAGG